MAEEKIAQNLERLKPEQVEGVAAEQIVERAPEQSMERAGEKAFEEENKLAAEQQGEAQVKVRRPKIKTKEQERAEEIDKILSDGLGEVFLSLPPQKQLEFQKGGEETVKKINELFSKAKVTLKKVVDLIKRWLKIIPGLNNFFLEQEAKIKADRIIKLKK